MRVVPPLDIAKGELQNEECDIEHLRTLSDCERGAMLAAACRAAAKLEESRVKAGLPPVLPDSWPPSTWDLLRKHAANANGS